MELGSLIIILVFVLPFLILIDIKLKYDSNPQISGFLLAITPLFSFFYIQHFWKAFFVLLFVLLYGLVLRVIAHNKSWLAFDIDSFKFHCIGSLAVSFVTYFVYFVSIRIGGLSESTGPVITPEKLNSAQQHAPTILKNTDYWPYLVYLLLVFGALFTIVLDRVRVNAESRDVAPNYLFLVMAGFSVLPLFTTSYWLYMLAGAVSFLFLAQLLFSSKTEVSSEISGLMFFYTYVYMLASAASIGLYIFFF